MRTIHAQSWLAGAMGAACALLAAGGCMPHRAESAPQEQAQTFETFDRLYRQIEALPNPRQRDELGDTVRLLETQLLFGRVKMPASAQLLLVSDIQISPMTQMGDWNNDGKIDGFEVFVSPVDSFGDPTKVVGRFLFDLFPFRAAHGDPRGLERVCHWEANIVSREANATFWDKLGRTYRFNLVWPDKAPKENRFVLQVTYVAPWGQLRQAQRMLTRTQTARDKPDKSAGPRRPF